MQIDSYHHRGEPQARIHHRPIPTAIAAVDPAQFLHLRDDLLRIRVRHASQEAVPTEQMDPVGERAGEGRQSRRERDVLDAKAAGLEELCC